jgi:hypothetical protein
LINILNKYTIKKTHDRGMGKPFLMGCGTCCE